MTPELRRAAERCIDALVERGLTVTTAESCTGGLVAAALTSMPGSSTVFDFGFVTYANRAKIQLLDVSPALLEAHGAVSPEVAEAMAEGARMRSGADIAVALTGVAGPGGGSAKNPVGLVYVGLAGPRTQVDRLMLGGGREAVRIASTRHALEMILAAASA